MPQYSFSLQHRDLEGEHLDVQELPGDQVAIDSAGQMLGPDHMAVSVGRGAGEDIEWLGAWDWFDGDPRWTIDEAA